MKRLFISAIIMMAFALNASAQLAPGKFSLQFKVGVSGSSFANSTDINVGQLQDQFIHLNGLPSNILDTTLEDEGAGGGTIGVDLEYQAAKWLGLSVGVGYLTQGTGWDSFKFKQDGTKYRINEPKARLGYLTVPVIANFYVYKGLALKSGVQFGFLTDAELMTNVIASGNKEHMHMDLQHGIKSNFENFDIAIPVGVSCEFGNLLVLDLRYNAGLKKVNKTYNIDGKDNKNRSLVFTLGYKLKL